MGNEDLKERIKDIYSEEQVKAALLRGVKPIKRFKELTKFSIEYFSQ